MSVINTFQATLWVIAGDVARRTRAVVTVHSMSLFRIKRKYTVDLGVPGFRGNAPAEWACIVPAAYHEGGWGALRVRLGVATMNIRRLVFKSFAKDETRKFFDRLAASAPADDAVDADNAGADESVVDETATVSPPRKRKKAIPRGVKQLVWNLHIGKEVGSAPCTICGSNEITQMHFHAAHIVPEARGGETAVHNLMPTCAQCNLSCGTMHLLDYKRMLSRESKTRKRRSETS